METVEAGQMVRLPHGEPVRVEFVYDDGQVRLRRIEGEQAGTIALCSLSSLQPFSENMDMPSGTINTKRPIPSTQLTSVR